MRSSILAILGLSVICVIADALLKRAGEVPRPFTSLYFGLGALLYGASAVGWVYVLQHIKLATVGALFSAAVALLLALIGVTFFKEPLATLEILGIGFIVVGVFLLWRFM